MDHRIMNSPHHNRFALDRRRAMFAGVCSGLARQFGINLTWLRVGTVIAVLLGFGFPVLAYIIIALVAPRG